MKRRVCCVTAILVLALVATIVPASQASPRKCGSTSNAGFRLHVTAQGAVKCEQARKLARDFFSRKGFRKHGGPDAASTYFTSRRWPGWKCGTGAGGGGCTAHRPFRRVIFQAEPGNALTARIMTWNVAGDTSSLTPASCPRSATSGPTWWDCRRCA